MSYIMSNADSLKYNKINNKCRNSSAIYMQTFTVTLEI